MAKTYVFIKTSQLPNCLHKTSQFALYWRLDIRNFIIVDFLNKSKLRYFELLCLSGDFSQGLWSPQCGQIRIECIVSHFVTGSPRRYFDCTDEGRVVTRVVHKLQVSQKVFNLLSGVKKTVPMEKRDSVPPFAQKTYGHQEFCKECLLSVMRSQWVARGH